MAANSTTAEKLAVAARNLLDKDGVEAVTMRNVAKAVGITPMAVYRHYPDHAALLNALADAGFDELTARLARTRLTGSIEHRLNQMLDVYFDHALDNPQLFQLMFLRPRKGARRFPVDFKAQRSPTANIMQQLIEQGIRSGHFRREDPWEINFEMGALVQGLMMLYLGGRISLSRPKFHALCQRSLRRYFHGIRK
jgi:AcrR family transcriptional regulator